MKFCLAALIALAAVCPSAVAQTAEPTWLRYPAISPAGRTIVFTYKGDLYRVPTAGGTAVALTSHQAEDFMPVWSHDGRQIAFASDRDGNKNVTTGRSLENQQTEPDIRVRTNHDVAAKGADQQLQTAVAELLKRLP